MRINKQHRPQASDMKPRCGILYLGFMTMVSYYCTIILFLSILCASLQEGAEEGIINSKVFPLERV